MTALENVMVGTDARHKTSVPGALIRTMSAASVTGGTSTVNGGTVTVAGAKLTSTATYSTGKAIETLATLGKNQSIGWVTSSNANVKMAFTVNAAGQLVASVNDGFLNNASAVARGRVDGCCRNKLRIDGRRAPQPSTSMTCRNTLMRLLALQQFPAAADRRRAE